MLAQPPRTAELLFDEVVSERIAAPQPDISGAVILSPTTTRVSVDWRRQRLVVSVKGGFAPGRVYRLELLPVLTDLRQNRMKVGRTIVFSTGPAIPAATLAGTVVDWTGGRSAPGALVEAVLLPDSLPYRALADSTGSFRMAGMPAGQYLVYGILDKNGNRRLDPREGFDTTRVTLADSAAVELYAFPHDTLGPRLRTADFVDSVTVRLTFDRPLDPGTPVDTANVRVAPASDSTQAVPLAAVYTPAAYDSVVRAEATARAAARAARDSAARAEAAARDTTRRRAAPPSAAPAAPAPAGQRPPPLGPEPSRDSTRAAKRDSTRALKMLARRPAPSDARVARLAAPLVPGTRYLIVTQGVRSLTGVAGHGRTTLPVPVPRRTRSAADSLRARAPADTSRAPGADTLRAVRDTTPAPPRRDSVPPPPRRDSTPPEVRSP